MKHEFKYFRENRQQVFDINTKDLVDFKFNEETKKVYKNANLSIFLDDYCNADCDFCVAQLRFENKGKMYKKEKIINCNEYLKRLDSILEYLEPLNLSISITGGEPTQSPKLVPVLEIINKHNLRKRVITTNGSGLFNKVGNRTILQHLIDNKFDHINISRAHFDEDINQKLMHFEDGYFSNEDMKKVLQIIKSTKLKARLSCILVKNGIHTIEDIKEYIQFYKKIGMTNVIFRELMDFNEDQMINIRKKEYCNENKIVLNDIWNKMDEDYEFKPIKNLLGYYYYVEIYEYKGIVMCQESANLTQGDIEREKNKNIIYELIFHPNGNLNGSWVDDEDILIKYRGV